MNNLSIKNTIFGIWIGCCLLLIASIVSFVGFNSSIKSVNKIENFSKNISMIAELEQDIFIAIVSHNRYLSSIDKGEYKKFMELKNRAKQKIELLHKNIKDKILIDQLEKLKKRFRFK